MSGGGVGSTFFGGALAGVVTGVVEEAPDFGSDAVAPAARAFFFALEVGVEVPSAGFADVPDADVAGILFAPDGLLVVGAGVVGAPAGLAVGFAPAGLVEPNVVPAAGVASAGLSGTDGKRCARISEARM